MSFQKTEDVFLSADRKTQVHYYCYLPEGSPKAIVQISHGMCEYLERYEKEGFVEALTDAGFVVCGNDHLGHGKSLTGEDDLGYFEDYRFLVEDLHTLNGILRKTYPRLPYVLFGHSMGSFVARVYAVTYQDIDGAVFCGTTAGNQPLKLARGIASMIGKRKGWRYKSNLIRNLSFAGYNKNFPAEKDPLSWLSSDKGLRDRYRDDPLCGFTFTCAAYRELFSMIAFISEKAFDPDGLKENSWAASVPQSLPVLLIAGDKDPVGDNGAGVQEVYDRLADRELNSLAIKLYPGGRHEIFNDTMKREVMSDLIDWVNEVAAGVVAARTYGAIPFGRPEAEA